MSDGFLDMIAGESLEILIVEDKLLTLDGK